MEGTCGDGLIWNRHIFVASGFHTSDSFGSIDGSGVGLSSEIYSV